MSTPVPPFRLAARPRDAHKASVGRVLVVGGSRDLCGAPSLVALGALRAGAGLVRVAVPRSIQHVVAGHRMEALTAGLDEDEDGALVPSALERVHSLAEQADVLAIGPGAGRAEGTLALLRSIVTDVALPAVVDADALFAWNERLDELAARREALVLTPHEGEAARLLGVSSGEVRADREGSARRIAETAGAPRAPVVVVLKGPATRITDGRRSHRNETGGPVLASGGTGDVLCGILAALMASTTDPYGAACLAAWVHGEAALCAASGLDRGVLASEVADALPAVLTTLVVPPGNDRSP